MSWVTESSLTKRIVSPGWIRSAVGENAFPFIDTVYSSAIASIGTVATKLARNAKAAYDLKEIRMLPLRVGVQAGHRGLSRNDDPQHGQGKM